MFSQALHYLALAGYFLTVFSQRDRGVVPNVQVRQTFTHPGLLQSSADFTRIQSKVNQKVEPWNTAWNKFLQSGYTNPSFTPNPVAIVYRGSDGVHAENYGNLYTDIAAAYALAVRWAITGDTQVGDAAVRIMDAWSSTLTQISGDNDQYLAAGIYGYEFASAAEIMRSYGGWPAANFLRFQNMMLQVFYPLVNGWFTQHSQWAENANAVYPGWDLCIIASAMAIGVLSDNRAIYNQGVSWYQNGTGNGNIHFAVPFTHTVDNEVMGQLLESGRDQGHAHLDIALLGVIGQIAYNQGDDLFGYDGNIILEAAEYFARYNLGNDVPYTPFNNGPLNLPTINNGSRGDPRPVWELLYNHYGVRENLNVPWTKAFRDYVVQANGGAEGGSGDYGVNSGGYDQLGWGTLLYTL